MSLKMDKMGRAWHVFFSVDMMQNEDWRWNGGSQRNPAGEKIFDKADSDVLNIFDN